MRKRSPSKALIDKCDKSLQCAYRRRYKGKPCEVCGKPFEISHHHIEKSKSNYLRFKQPKNYVFLCHHCHSLIIFGDNHIVATYSAKRGKKWVEEIGKLKTIKKPYFSKKELLEIKDYYDKWKEKKEQLIQF